MNGDFETSTDNRFSGWGWQDDIGVTTFADHDILRGGTTSLALTTVTASEGEILRELEEAGVPKHDIVLGFRHPDVRPLTEYAVA